MAKKIDINTPPPQLVSINLVAGSTTINHNARVKLNLSMDEYAIVDLIERFHRDSKPIDYTVLYSGTGIDHDKIKSLFETLWEHGYIETSNTLSKFKPTDKWYEGFPSTAKEFDEFWSALEFMTTTGKKKISWGGSKTDAMNKFVAARRIESFEYLLAQKLAYFKMIASSDFRQVMGCSVFLNTTTKRYSEDWGAQTKKDVVQEIKEQKKITKEDMKSKF